MEETLLDLNCSTKRKVQCGYQPPCLLAVDPHQVGILPGLRSTPNMNFKSWLLRLMGMDQRPLLRWREQRKMVWVYQGEREKMTTDSENSLQESYRLYLSIHRLEIEITYLLATES